AHDPSHLGNGDSDAEISQRSDPVFRNSAGHDAGKMPEVGRDVERDPVIADPAPYPDADGGDLVLAADTRRPGATVHPDADPAVTPLAPDAVMRKGCDQPCLEILHK